MAFERNFGQGIYLTITNAQLFTLKGIPTTVEPLYYRDPWDHMKSLKCPNERGLLFQITAIVYTSLCSCTGQQVDSVLIGAVSYS